MAEEFQTLSNALVDAVEKAGPSVVRVEARRRLPASGIVFAPDVVVTAHHVVQVDEDIRVGLPGGEVVDAALAGRDPGTDLAVLRVEGADLSPASWVEGVDLRVGGLVLAVGRPGANLQAALGVISAIEDLSASRMRRAFGASRLNTYLRPDVVMYPGFSGGPLVAASGGVVGMNTSALAHGSALTIPAADLAPIVETLLAHGRLRRGYLGVSTQPVRLPGALRDELNQATGVHVVAVEPGSPADEGGLVLGDTIVAFDGVPTIAPDDLLALLAGDRIGQQVSVRVVRGGELRDLTVTVGERG
jgi:S1-C subfamily serine protease